MRFTLKQLEYFLAAAEAGSITIAAARARISQPSISAAISRWKPSSASICSSATRRKASS